MTRTGPGCTWHGQPQTLCCGSQLLWLLAQLCCFVFVHFLNALIVHTLAWSRLTAVGLHAHMHMCGQLSGPVLMPSVSTVVISSTSVYCRGL
jgi:hypothetical protein